MRSQDADHMDGDEATSTLQQLGKALQGATEHSRFFRASAQWASAYWKWAAAAVALGHMEWTWCVAHHDVVCQIAEQQRQEGKGPYAAFLYDSMLRRQIESRVAKKDPSLDIKKVWNKVDKELLSIVGQRLQSVLREADIGTKMNAGSASSRGFEPQGAMEVAVDFHVQSKRAAQTLMDQQKRMLETAAGMQNAKGAGKKGGKGKGKQNQWDGYQQQQQQPEPSKKQQKRQQWWQNKWSEIQTRPKKAKW